MKKNIDTFYLYNDITSAFFRFVADNTSSKSWSSMSKLSVPFDNNLPIQTSLRDIITAE